MINKYCEYKNLGFVFFISFFCWPVFSQETETISENSQEERADVEDFLHRKTEEMFEEYNGQERFFEHTYFYYHENLQRLNRNKKKNVKIHPFFIHYQDCLENIKQDQNHCKLLSQVFTDALWDLDARWRQMKTSGVHYRRRPGKNSPSLIFIQYLLAPEQQKILNNFPIPDQLRLYILALKNDLMDNIPEEKEADFIHQIESVDQDQSSLEDSQLGALKAAYHTIIDGPLLIEKGSRNLFDSALALEHQSLDLLKDVLLPDYGAEYLGLDIKQDENKIPEADLQELLNFEPDWKAIQDEKESFTQTEDTTGLQLRQWKYLERLLKYKDGPRLFVLCRQNREFPCLMLMRDEKGEWAYQQGKDKLWFHRAMASSNKGWSFYKRLGHTPAGVYTIDGIMPFTNRRRLFGQFHRLILNYLPGNASDLSYNKLMLPIKNWENENWWKQAPLAKTLGRNLLRIHGTGKRARKNTTYFPLVKTNGCISQIEGKYGKKVIQDQKDLLAQLQRLQKTSRMSDIKGLLYVVEIDNQESEVTLSEIVNKLE